MSINGAGECQRQVVISGINIEIKERLLKTWPPLRSLPKTQISCKMYFHQTSTGLSPRKGASCCSSELLNVYLMRYSGWRRPGTLSADMLWRLRENQWVEGVPSREAAAETKMLPASHTFLVIFNHLKLICLQSVSSALVWPPACSGCTTELLNIPVPHQYISHFTITLHHSSVFRHESNRMSQQTGLSMS